MLSSARPTSATAKAGRARLPKVALTPPAKKPASGTKPDRKADILLAAEKLFAKHGYHAVSIRQIADEAGVPLALVGYHYGPKHELFYAIFQHWNSTIEERMQALREVTIDQNDAETLPRIIDAFVGPVLRMRA
ncbi:MAG: TetR/AcrR family transcriptional regulator, partial [Pseudomonadota bacterium]